jgi:hypothetical protein
VAVHADASQAIDFKDYNNDLKRYGTSIRAGDSVPITLIKVKKDLVELQLAGGGFGTFGDDTSTSANLKLPEKTSRERDLEKRIKDEDDRDRRRRLERDLDDLRESRERETARVMAERERIEEQKRERIAEQRLRGGSRFNVRYDDRVPVGMRAEDLMAALAEYVDFGGRPAGRETSAPPPTADVTMVRKGLLRSDAERLFGLPASASQRREGALEVTTLVFLAGDQRITAEFVDEVLIRYTIMSR